MKYLSKLQQMNNFEMFYKIMNPIIVIIKVKNLRE